MAAMAVAASVAEVPGHVPLMLYVSEAVAVSHQAVAITNAIASPTATVFDFKVVLFTMVARATNDRLTLTDSKASRVFRESKGTFTETLSSTLCGDCRHNAQQRCLSDQISHCCRAQLQVNSPSKLTINIVPLARQRHKGPYRMKLTHGFSSIYSASFSLMIE
jgi:hypothetical protein